MTTEPNRRILLIDDLPAIHADFHKILVPERANPALDAVEAALFGDSARAPGAIVFELTSAYQGQEGLAALQRALAAGRPHAMAFVDMRMPPGWDGVETIERLWQADPRLQVVICTAHSDGSWHEVLTRLDVRDRLLVLKKPFDPIEVQQLAGMLTTKWQMAQRAAEQHSVLENQLLQSEKLASIGQLAAGVAHEINNPIGYVFSNYGSLERYLAQLFEMLAAYEQAEASIADPAVAARLQGLRQRLELELLKEDIPQLMRESKQGVTRVRQIVQDLKDFSRADSAQEWEWADLHRGLDSTLNVVANEIKYKADVVKEYGELPDVCCLPSQINQVAMNLLVNAAQAMGSERGRITVRTGSAGDSVWFEVADTGAGMTPDVMRRVFEPFYTTKPIGQGTGLGLSVSYGIVQKHQGRIEVSSTAGVGTTFRVTLPVCQADVHVEPALGT